MDFRWGRHFIVSIPPTIGSTIALAIVFTILIRVVPTIGAARHTIISYKMDQSRLLRRPWWQRLGVDVLLLIFDRLFLLSSRPAGRFDRCRRRRPQYRGRIQSAFRFPAAALDYFRLDAFLAALPGADAAGDGLAHPMDEQRRLADCHAPIGALARRLLSAFDFAGLDYQPGHLHRVIRPHDRPLSLRAAVLSRVGRRVRARFQPESEFHARRRWRRQ